VETVNDVIEIKGFVAAGTLVAITASEACYWFNVGDWDRIEFMPDATKSEVRGG
jgi:hypothetical protein